MCSPNVVDADSRLDAVHRILDLTLLSECDLAHRERQLSKDEPHLKGATTAACTCRRSQRVALRQAETCQTELRYGPDPMQLLAHVESVGLVLQAR